MKYRSHTDELLRLDRQFCVSLYSASRIVVQVYQKLLKPFDLTYTQYIVLLALFEYNDLPVRRLGELLFLDSGTLSPLLKKLEEKKLIQRLPDPKDERGVRIKLTSKGLGLKEELPCVPEGALKIISGKLSFSKLVALRNSLKKLTTALYAELQNQK